MDALFKALGDDTRRKLLDMLRERDGQTLTELEARLGMTRFGVMKHLKVLEEASLVVTRRSGRFKYHYLNAVPLQEAIDRWIEPLTQKPMARYVLDMKAQLEGTKSMDATTKAKPDFILETYIRASAEDLWDALTNPDKTEKYHFAAARIRSDLKKGSRFDHITPDGNVMLGGEILDIDPPHRLEMTFEPGWMGPDAKSSRCVYEIEQQGDNCKLAVLHYEIPQGQENVRDGWTTVVSSLKSWLETGKPLKWPRQD